MKDLKLLINEIERELLANLLVSLKNGKLSKSEAKKVARDFVDQNYNSQDQLFDNLYLISDSSHEARRVFVKYAPAYFEVKDLKALDTIRYNFRDILRGDEQNGR